MRDLAVYIVIVIWLAIAGRDEEGHSVFNICIARRREKKGSAP